MNYQRMLAYTEAHPDVVFARCLICRDYEPEPLDGHYETHSKQEFRDVLEQQHQWIRKAKNAQREQQREKRRGAA